MSEIINVIKRNRHLVDESNVFEHNAWDDYEMDEDMKKEAEMKFMQQAQKALEQQSQQELNMKKSNIESQSQNHWDRFYLAHQDKFFKDRKWLFSEFPELSNALEPDYGLCNILELGCGVGNTLVPILKQNRNKNLKIYACDISSTAVETLKSHELLTTTNTNTKSINEGVVIFQKDFTQTWTKEELDLIPKGQIDFIILIFVLSAIQPEKMAQSLSYVTKQFLNRDGMILLRDYARYDMTQLRFKPQSYLNENYYVRGDGTTSYFFTEEKLDELLKSAGLIKIQLNTDRRLLCNRARELKMCRCWIQAKYRKNLDT